MGIRGLRNGAIVTFVVSMAILLVGGYFAKDKVPPIPAKVVSGQTAVTDQAAILRGQDMYQRYGLMDHGSVWGHGSLRGMDFSAYTLHWSGEHMRRLRGSRRAASGRAPMRACPTPRSGRWTRPSSTRCAPTATTRAPRPWS